MSAGLPMENCPSEESLAAFIDGHLEEAARRNIVEHMAQCAACRDTLLMADEIAAAGVVPRGGAVVRGRFPNRMIAAAAAAAVILVVLIPDVRDRVFGGGTGMGALVRAAEDYEKRPTLGRLNSKFEFRVPPKQMRGTTNRPKEWQGLEVERIVSTLEDLEAKTPLSQRDLHVLGVSHLLRNRPQKAIARLEAAVIKCATAESEVGGAIQSCDDVDLLTDLVNAYLKRGNASDLVLAREVAARAWRLAPSPPTAWNRALTLEESDPAEALKAWDSYLELDSESAWADEARDRRARLAPD